MIVGITTTLNEEDGYERTNVEYIERVAAAGATPLLLSPVPGGDEANLVAARALVGRIDGLVLSGGGDIDPALYGQERLGETVDVARNRDALELELARLAFERNLPTLGICRGMQVLDVALGGTLYQDMRACGLTEAEHRQEPPYAEARQRIDVAAGSLLACVLCDGRGGGMRPGCKAGWPADLETGREGSSCTLQVNTMHHQAIAALASPLVASAVSDDGIVEAVEAPDLRFYLGVQWHPEYLDDNAPLFQALADAL